MDANEIATKNDIEILKSELLEIKALLKNQPSPKPFLRSADVRKLLNISDGTLQRLRISGTISGHKINGTWFYKYNEIFDLIK